jgi:cyclase
MWDLPHTAAMLEAFRPRLEKAPIDQLVNTHADGDHCFGNSLVNAGKRVATRAAARDMVRHGPSEMRALATAARAFKAVGTLPFGAFHNWRLAGDYFQAMIQPYDFSLPKPPLPNCTFREKFALDVGGRHVLLTELGPAHTKGDLAVLLPEDRVLFAGDLVFSGIHPVLWDGSVRNWLRACDWMLEQRVDVVVPGHGPLSDLRAVEAMRSYWQFLSTAAEVQLSKGRKAAMAARWIAVDEEYLRLPFSRWEGQERLVLNVHAIYRKLARRPRRMGVWERLMALKDAAIFADELKRAGGIDRLRLRIF